ncbi:MAG TPA: hypothetical protein VGS80_22135 [Ktedonobacterales bacterium]|nr:hypothetical protein [Ktedonobacterales bacterium]
MIVQRVSFRRLINLGNYENFAIEMEALCGESEDPLQAMRRLAEQVSYALRQTLEDHDHWRVSGMACDPPLSTTNELADGSSEEDDGEL